MYDHWYKNDKDLLLFDNSIVLHRRLGDTKNRMCFRIQHDLVNLHDNFYQPYSQKEYADQYTTIIKDFVDTLNLKGYHI